jgi:tRNA-dihydrouridine synthase A
MGANAAAGGGGVRTAPPEPQLLSVAPMMDWTDLHYRYLARLMSRHTWLYTEMVVDSTLIHNPDHDRFLWFPPEQHPIVCQLGGSDPEKLGKAAAIVAKFGYDEINLNCGCPR